MKTVNFKAILRSILFDRHTEIETPTGETITTYDRSRWLSVIVAGMIGVVGAGVILYI